MDGLTLRQRTADAETAPSRSPGAGVVVRRRENAGLALIRPAESKCAGGRSQRRGILSMDASGLGPRLLVRRMRSFLSFRLKPRVSDESKESGWQYPMQVALPNRWRLRDLSGEPTSLMLPYEDEIRRVEWPCARRGGPFKATGRSSSGADRLRTTDCDSAALPAR